MSKPVEIDNTKDVLAKEIFARNPKRSLEGLMALPLELLFALHHELYGVQSTTPEPTDWQLVADYGRFCQNPTSSRPLPRLDLPNPWQ